MANDFIINFLLCILFVVKLRQVVFEFEVIHNWDLSSVHHREDSEFSDDSSLTRKGYHLLDVVTRHSIIFGIAIFTNQVYFISGLFISFSKLVENNFAHAAGLSVGLRAWENVVNLFALWISLSMNVNIYMKLCKFCHICVQKQFARKTRENVINHYMELDSTDGN